MTSPFFWVVANTAGAIIVATVLAYMLHAYADEICLAERIGLGAAGAAMLLRIGPIIGRNVMAETSPFDDWSVTFLHIGMAVYALGWLWRKEGHAWRALWRRRISNPK